MDFSAAQLRDLAKLLDQSVIPGNLLTLVDSLLDPPTATEAKKHFDKNDFPRHVVDALNGAGRIPEAVAALRQGTNANSRLAFGLNEILQGRDLDEGALQAFVNTYQPFFNSDEFRKKFPRIMRTVCAIGLGHGVNSLVGTGFLIGPDLVMTNYHVLEQYLKIDEGGAVVENGDGTQIFFFFDYLSEPGPRFPLPANGTYPFLKVTAIKEKWLVKARVKLPGEGERDHQPADIQDRYDYAVIRIERKVGNLPAERSGSGARGWLTLTDDVDKTVNRRVILYQHPGKAPQQFDIGEYKQLDTSNTRVRYTVSAAKGSSGGAAVDNDGQLFALHVSEVRAQGPLGQLNQGVLIDLIAKDLQGTAGWDPQPPPDEEPMSFWSLSDDLKSPQPIIGRRTFRDHVYDLSTKPKPRVMVVWGPPGSGVKYSTRLLQRIVGAQTPVIQFSQQDLSTKGPREFVRSLLSALGIIGQTIPEPNPTEGLPRFLRDLALWLAERLAEDEKKRRVVYPAWIVLNTLVGPGANFEWTAQLDEFIAAIAGSHDVNHEAIDIPQLRLLFLTSAPASLPLNNVDRIDEDLTLDTSYVDDYLVCLQRALHALDKDDDFGAVNYFKGKANTVLAKNPNAPARQVLSELVRDMFFEASKA